eukprot:Amastigsp_a361484_2.p4 type:complete len:105 gc:universal Amastigsp_a361484_2:91-405(+)
MAGPVRGRRLVEYAARIRGMIAGFSRLMGADARRAASCLLMATSWGDGSGASYDGRLQTIARASSMRPSASAFENSSAVHAMKAIVSSGFAAMRGVFACCEESS